MDPAALVRDALGLAAKGGDEAGVLVRDDQPNPGQAPLAQGAQDPYRQVLTEKSAGGASPPPGTPATRKPHHSGPLSRAGCSSLHRLGRGVRTRTTIEVRVRGA